MKTLIRQTTPTIILLTALAAAFSLPHTSSAAPQKPLNVVFFLADDLRPDGLHSLGIKIVKSPHLDKLVDQGFIFRSTYVLGSNVGAVCTPSRTMMQTGVSYFRTHRMTPTWAETIHSAGYASIRSGKFGNNPNQLDKVFDKHVDGETAEGNANNIIAFIKNHAGDKPLFLYMAPHEPHDPQYAPDNYYAKYRPEDIPLPVNFLRYHPFDNGELTVRDELTLPWPRTRANVTGKLARYYASTEYFDDQCQRVIEALKQAGQFDNTIFIIAGDNGLSLGEHGLLGKQNLYEFGGMHVPLVFVGPGIPKGETHAICYLMDIYPTICELTGVPVPKGLDAKSQLPVISGKASEVRHWCFTAYRDVQRSIRDDRWKLIRYPKIDKTQLFDLQSDPHEMTDLSDRPESAAKIKELLAQLEISQREFGDTCPLTVANPQPAAWTPPAEDSTPKKAKRAKKKAQPAAS